MKVIHKVLVGSQLHGLANEDSDYDYRGVHVYPLPHVLSPFKRLKNTSWIEGDTDNTSYELADFCKQAVQGNATILEVLFSNRIEETTDLGKMLTDNREKFLDTTRIVAAAKGYAHNQFNKMNLFDPDARTPKFAVAYLRVMWQTEQFLLTGDFPCQITDEKEREYMLHIKYNMDEMDVPDLQNKFYEMQGRVTQAFKTAKIKTPDLEWIEGFIYHAYTA